MKIPTSDRVRIYELTVMLPGTDTSDVIGEVTAVIEKLVSKHKIKVVLKEEWGKRSLSYPIKHAGQKQNEANYFHFVLEAHSKDIPKFESDLRLNQQILRSLLVLGDENSAKVPEAVETPTEKEVKEVKVEEVKPVEEKQV